MNGPAQAGPGRWAGTALVAVAALTPLPAQAPPAAPPSADPVVLVGARLPALLGSPPDRIVAFAYRAGWQRIPVQVDERARIPYRQVLQRRVRNDLAGLLYTDAGTFTGPDPDPRLDADDELVVMAADAGGKATAADPAGTRPGSRVELALPESPAGQDHIYLFESLTPADTVARRVRYRFRLRAGSYKDNYELRSRPNPEDSTITTAAYRLGFRDRWILDELRLTIGATSGSDILDRHKVQVIPGSCIRTTQTFCNGPGAIIANIDGPLRAIRAVIGANSGPLTERVWICYPRRFDIVTYLRVHALPSVLMFFDYSPAAIGMRYHDNHNRGGFTIDGRSDPARTGELLWQYVTGAPGSLRILFQLDTTMRKLVRSSLYDDNRQPGWNQCTGDGHAFGAGGPLLQNLTNTDPRLGHADRLTSRVVVYPGPANQPLPGADQLTMPAPLRVEVRSGPRAARTGR